MKKILGSIIFLSLSLFAKSQYHWDVHLQKEQLYLHEATTITLKCTFEKEGKNDDVELKMPVMSAFEFKLFSETRDVVDGRKSLTYKFLLFARESGEQSLHIKPTMLFTTQEAINDVIIGRDNVNDLAVEKEVAKLDPVAITVLPSDANITARLTLTSKIDKKEVSAFEPVHTEVRIKGVGNLQDLRAIVMDIDGVKTFYDDPIATLALDEEGYQGEWAQKFAFVGEKSFTIPAFTLKYFDLNQKKMVSVQSEVYEVKIKEDGIKREELLDNIEQEPVFIWKMAYLYYVLTFLAGFITAKLFRLPQRTRAFVKGEKIKEAKSAKELLEVLINCDKEQFKDEIETLERVVYKGEVMDLKKIKKLALSRII